jgi:hypothetical protein
MAHHCSSHRFRAKGIGAPPAYIATAYVNPNMEEMAVDGKRFGRSSHCGLRDGA